MAPQKKVFRASYVWWASTITAFLIGLVIAIGAVILELRTQDAWGLIMMIISPLWLAAAGVFATVAAKKEAEENQKS
jgi:high-affinity Fe2+/Pb2+ permease